MIVLAGATLYAFSNVGEMKVVKPVELFQTLLTSGSVKKIRLLSLDVGQKYIGLAISETCNKIASPLSVLVRKKTNIDLMSQDFRKLISQFSIGGFVVGRPLGLQGQSSVEANQVDLFMEKLKKNGKLDDMKYIYWNENYTSKSVQALLDNLNLHYVEYKTMTDKFAAVNILQGYLDEMNRRISQPTAPDHCSPSRIASSNTDKWPLLAMED